jgi:hypothetical protein
MPDDFVRGGAFLAQEYRLRIDGSHEEAVFGVGEEFQLDLLRATNE